MRMSDWSSDVCSSDLAGWLLSRMGRTVREFASGHRPIVDCGSAGFCRHLRPAFHGPWIGRPRDSGLPDRRSEEHTSELQSLMRNSYAVFCLKKKTDYETTHCMYHTLSVSPDITIPENHIHLGHTHAD